MSSSRISVVTNFAPALIGLLHDAADQGQRFGGRGQHQFLARAQPKANAHGNLGQAVELLIEAKARQTRERKEWQSS